MVLESPVTFIVQGPLRKKRSEEPTQQPPQQAMDVSYKPVD